jgi:RsiW-degrading membrane proteinase PrsW (M82 family)
MLERLRIRGLIGAMYYTETSNQDQLVRPNRSFTPAGVAWRDSLCRTRRSGCLPGAKPSGGLNRVNPALPKYETMNGIANRPACPPASTVGRALRRPWLQVLVIGSALWLLLTWGTLSTKNFHLVPSVIVMGAFLGPVAFVAFVYERAREVPLPALLWCFIVGGVLGVTAASVLEYRTLIDFGALPTIAIGLIEESCKLLVPIAIFMLGRYRREADGLLFGVASGLGFAALESMGYGLTALFLSHGHIGEVEKLLFVRGVLSPAGHGAWTGLVCAILWRSRVHPTPGAKATVVAAFIAAATLHALWDAATSVWLQLAVAAVSLSLLFWRMHVAGRESAEQGVAAVPWTHARRGRVPV